MPIKRTIYFFAANCLICCNCTSGQDGMSVQKEISAKEMLTDSNRYPGLSSLFDEESLKQLQNGADREEILDALETLTITGTRPFSMSNGTLRVLYHISDGHPSVQKRLFRIVTHEHVRRSTLTFTCSLLSLEASEQVRRELLEHIKGIWREGYNWELRRVLRDHGDVRYLKFLEKKFATLNNSPFEADIEREIREIRAVQHLPQLLEIIRTGDDNIDSSWLVMQAARRGAKRKDIHDAIMQYLKLPEDGISDHFASGLIYGGNKLKIFSITDAEVFNRGGSIGPVVDLCNEEPLPWANLHKKKFRECYGLIGKRNKDD